MFRSFRLTGALACLLVCSAAAQAAGSAVPFSPASVAKVAPVPLRPTDTIMGPLARTQPLHVLVSLKLRNEDLLDAVIQTAATPNAVTTGAGISDEEFLANHAPTQEQADAVVRFLADAGFQNIEIAPNRLLVSAYGNAGIAQRAFATSLVQVRSADGRDAYANNDAVRVPPELQDSVLEVVGLQTVYTKHVMSQAAQPGMGPLATPQAGSAVGHNPVDFATIYGANTLAVASRIPVGVVTEGNMTNTKNNLNSFTATHGLPTQTVQVVGAGSSDTSGDGEWALDTQDIVAMTGGVQKLILYDSASLFDSDLDVAFNAAVAANATKVISVSLGACETGSPLATEDAIFKSGVAKGQTFVFSSGDSGADECGNGGVTPSYPASSPYVVAVGGTTLFTSGSTTWSGESVWSGTGGSPSLSEAIPTWQSHVGQNGNNTHRGVPDIAFVGDPQSGAIITIGAQQFQYGGTSLSAPLFSGAWARIMQTNGQSLGFAAPLIYQVAAVPAQYATDFHDVTSGGNNGETAATGWDYTTGFGSMIVNKFITHLGGGSTPAKLAFTVQPNASYGAGATITVKVSIETSTGAVVTSDTSAVTLALSGGTAGATLGGTKTVNAVAGVATFSNLTVNKVGTAYVLNASDGSLSGASSTGFNITSGTATSITFTTQPSANANVAAGATIPLVAHVQDANANPVAGHSVSLAFGANPGSATLSVTANPVATDASGNATFGNVSLNKVASGYTLKATDNTTPLNVTGNSFNIVAGTASSITFSTQPAANANVAAASTIPLVAHVQDANANPIAGHSVSLALGANPAGATLSVTATPVPTDASGNATFANVSLNKVGTGYTLKATDNTTPLNVTSNSFNIVAGTATSLTLTTQPAAGGNVAAGHTIALVAHVQDANGNAVGNHSISLALLNNPGGATLGVTATPIPSNAGGDAAFANVSLDKAGSGYTLQVTDNTTPLNATSNAFNIVAAAPTQLLFVQQPGNGTAGVALAPTITLRVLDQFGNVALADTNTVTLNVSGPGGFDPAATRTVALNNGLASFDRLLFNVAGAGYTLSASDSGDGLGSAPSNAFAIAPGTPRLVFSGPADLAQGGRLGSISVTADDGSGNLVPLNGSVDFTIAACGGTLDLGSVTMTNGIATLDSAQQFYSASGGETIQATSGALSGTSRSFVVSGAGFVFADSFDGCRL